MIYFDNSSTTYIKPDCVSDAVYKLMKYCSGNPGRGGHRISLKANDVVYNAREVVSELFNIKNPSRVCFVNNATTGLNYAIKGLLNKGDKVLVSGFEHNSVMRPLYTIGAEITVFPWYEYNEYENIASYLKDKKAIIVNHMSNVNGNIANIKNIGEIARREGVVFVVDASQSAGHVKIDVEKDNIDVLVAAGHKGLFGPQGTGLIYIREGVNVNTIIEGGTGSYSSYLTQPDILPDKFEAGTLNVPGIGGLAEGIKYILDIGIEKINIHEENLADILISCLKQYKNIEVYENKNIESYGNVVGFNICGWDCVELCNYLSEKYNIMLRGGLHCAPLAHKTLGTENIGCVRVSFSYFNKQEEVFQFLNIIDKISMM